MQYPRSKYTITLQEALDQESTLLSDIISLDTDEHTSAFIKMLTDMYWNYEIAGETIGEFKNMLNHRYGMYRDYYVELLNAYETPVNMLDGNKIETTYSNTGEDTDYDLPRSSSTEEHPSSKSSSETGGTSTTKGGNQVALKEQYMRMLRSVYIKFARELSPCFLTMFD